MTSTPSSLFYAATPNPLLIGIGQWWAPVIAQWQYQFRVVVDAESLERLRSQRDQRLILLPNHSCFDDPPVIFTLSAHLGLRFHYMGALEVFESTLGKWLQRLGVYSIRRGFIDRTSIAYTLNLISQPECKLVIFAEGGCSFQNDTIMPFRPGAIQMAFQVLNRFHKLGEPIPNIFLAPVGIKYHYPQDLSQVLATGLQSLEKCFDFSSQGTAKQRLCRIAQQRIGFWELMFGLKTDEAAFDDWEGRILVIQETVFFAAEQELGLETNFADSARDRAYRILSALGERPIPPGSEGKPEHVALQVYGLAVRQILNYIAAERTYLDENPSQERLLDALIRMERDVFQIDKPRPKGNRIAYVRVGELVNLKDWFPQYLCDRSGVIDQVSELLQQRVQEQVNLICQEHPSVRYYQ